MNTPQKKRISRESDYTTSEDGYDTDSTVLASPYDIEKQRVWERENKKRKLDRQNEEYERRQLLRDVVPPTVVLDRKTNQPFYIKKSEGVFEIVTTANIRNSNIFYNKDGQQINPVFLDFTNESGGKLRRKTQRIRKKSRKSRKPRKSRKSKNSRKYK